MEEQDGQRPSKRVRLSLPRDDAVVGEIAPTEPPEINQPPRSIPDDRQVMTDVPEPSLPGLGFVESQNGLVEDAKQENVAEPVSSHFANESEAAASSTHQSSEQVPIETQVSFEISGNDTTDSVKPIKVEEESLESRLPQNEVLPADPSTKVESEPTRSLNSDSNMDTEDHLLVENVLNPEDSVKAEDGEEREWETDSSPYESSDEDEEDSDDDSSSDDGDDSDEEFKLLDPAEAVRMLMADEPSDDEGGGKSKAKTTRVKTQHEELDEPIEMPDIQITEEMEIVMLGKVESIVEGMVLIKAKATGEYQVLEPRSVLCSSDRKLLGVVSETMGQIQQPYYVLRFKDEAAITGAEVATGKEIFYVPSHSKFVFTKALQSVKGSDASNFYDEEVGADELEFSDDEAEAEHKRRKKMAKSGNSDAKEMHSGGNAGRGRGRGRGSHSQYQPSGLSHHAAYTEDTEMNYGDDVKTGDTSYTPLARPTEMTRGYIAPTEGSHSQGRTDHRSHADRGRDQRGGRGAYRGRGTRPHYDDRPKREHQGGYSTYHQPYPPTSQQTQPPPPPPTRTEPQPTIDPSAPSFLPPPPKLPDAILPPQNPNPYSLPGRAPQIMMPHSYSTVPTGQPMMQPAPFSPRTAQHAVLSQYPQQSYVQQPPPTPQPGQGYIHPSSFPGYTGPQPQTQGYGMYGGQAQGQGQTHGQGQYGYQQQYAQGYQSQSYAQQIQGQAQPYGSQGQGQPQSYPSQGQGQEQPYYGYQSMQNQGYNGSGSR